MYCVNLLMESIKMSDEKPFSISLDSPLFSIEEMEKLKEIFEKESKPNGNMTIRLTEEQFKELMELWVEDEQNV